MAKPTAALLRVIRQKWVRPQMKFNKVPSPILIIRAGFFFEYISEPRPMIYAIRGNERINPPVGPTIDCHPPVKLEKTGRPNTPSSTYMSVAAKAGFAPIIIAARLIIKV